MKYDSFRRLMRKTGLATASLVAVLAAIGQSRATATPLAELVKEDSERVRRSIHAVRLSDGEAAFSHHAERTLIPASVTKVVTSAAVLDRFSPFHQIETPLYYTGRRKGRRIHGDLIVVGKGDPLIISEKLWQLAANVRHLGLREITGDLVIDNRLFSGPRRDASRESGEDGSTHAYDAPVTAFGVNFNTVAVAFAPNPKTGGPAYAGFDPYPLDGISLRSKVRTSNGRAGKSLRLTRVTRKKEGDVLIAKGQVPQGMPLRRVYRSVGDPVTAAGAHVKAFLEQAGVRIRGTVKDGEKPDDATKILAIKGYPLKKIVTGLNTYSNNYVADVLLKRLGASFPQKGSPEAPGQGSLENGLAAVGEFLEGTVGIDSDFVLENGSGLSPKNRLSCKQITRVLSYMAADMNQFPEFLASLPAAGRNGTLESRFAAKELKPLRGAFRAKSGTLTSPVAVSGLAGYFRHPNHGMMAFCVLENGIPDKPQPSIPGMRQREDKLLAALWKGLNEETP